MWVINYGHKKVRSANYSSTVTQINNCSIITLVALAPAIIIATFAISDIIAVIAAIAAIAVYGATTLPTNAPSQSSLQSQP